MLKSINQEAAVFLKKRAQIEEEYGKALLKLSQSHKKTDGKEG